MTTDIRPHLDRILAMTPQERYAFRQQSDIADSFVSLALDLEHRQRRLEREGNPHRPSPR